MLHVLIRHSFCVLLACILCVFLFIVVVTQCPQLVSKPSDHFATTLSNNTYVFNLVWGEYFREQFMRHLCGLISQLIKYQHRTVGVPAN